MDIRIKADSKYFLMEMIRRKQKLDYYPSWFDPNDDYANENPLIREFRLMYNTVLQTIEDHEAAHGAIQKVEGDRRQEKAAERSFAIQKYENLVVAHRRQLWEVAHAYAQAEAERLSYQAKKNALYPAIKTRTLGSNPLATYEKIKATSSSTPRGGPSSCPGLIWNKSTHTTKAPSSAKAITSSSSSDVANLTSAHLSHMRMQQTDERMQATQAGGKGTPAARKARQMASQSAVHFEESSVASAVDPADTVTNGTAADPDADSQEHENATVVETAMISGGTGTRAAVTAAAYKETGEIKSLTELLQEEEIAKLRRMLAERDREMAAERACKAEEESTRQALEKRRREEEKAAKEEWIARQMLQSQEEVEALRRRVREKELEKAQLLEEAEVQKKAEVNALKVAAVQRDESGARMVQEAVDKVAAGNVSPKLTVPPVMETTTAPLVAPTQREIPKETVEVKEAVETAARKVKVPAQDHSVVQEQASGEGQGLSQGSKEEKSQEGEPGQVVAVADGAGRVANVESAEVAITEKAETGEEGPVKSFASSSSSSSSGADADADGASAYGDWKQHIRSRTTSDVEHSEEEDDELSALDNDTAFGPKRRKAKESLTERAIPLRAQQRAMHIEAKMAARMEMKKKTIEALERKRAYDASIGADLEETADSMAGVTWTYDYSRSEALKARKERFAMFQEVMQAIPTVQKLGTMGFLKDTRLKLMDSILEYNYREGRPPRIPVVSQLTTVLAHQRRDSLLDVDVGESDDAQRLNARLRMVQVHPGSKKFDEKYLLELRNIRAVLPGRCSQRLLKHVKEKDDYRCLGVFTDTKELHLMVKKSNDSAFGGDKALRKQHDADFRDLLVFGLAMTLDNQKTRTCHWTQRITSSRPSYAVNVKGWMLAEPTMDAQAKWAGEGKRVEAERKKKENLPVSPVFAEPDSISAASDAVPSNANAQEVLFSEKVGVEAEAADADAGVEGGAGASYHHLGMSQQDDMMCFEPNNADASREELKKITPIGASAGTITEIRTAVFAASDVPELKKLKSVGFDDEHKPPNASYGNIPSSSSSLPSPSSSIKMSAASPTLSSSSSLSPSSASSSSSPPSGVSSSSEATPRSGLPKPILKQSQ